MMRHYYLRDSAHAYGVGSHAMIHLIFCRSLECRSLHAHIHTVYQTYAFLHGYSLCLCYQFAVICLVHVRKTWSGGEVLSSQRMFGEEVYVVGDNHQIAYLELRVHSSGSVRYEKSLDAKLIHHSYRECHLLHRVSLIIMESSFHCHDVLVPEFSEYKFTRVSFYCRNREIWYILIRKFVTVSYF